MRRRWLLLPVLLWGGAVPLLAQGDCFPGSSSNEAKVLALKGVALAFSRLGSPRRPRPGQVAAGVEGSYVPRVDDASATPTICRPGKGPENANPLDFLVRPRLALGLPGGLVFDAGWTPPFRLAGVRANLLGIALAGTAPLRPSVTLAVRAHGTVGRIRAPITCPDEALADPASTCYQGTRSDDRYDPNMYGVEAALGFGAGAAALRPYAGAGYTRLMPRFQVNFVNSADELDNRRVSVDLNRVALFGGATWSFRAGWQLSGEIYAVPADAVTGRVLLQVEP